MQLQTLHDRRSATQHLEPKDLKRRNTTCPIPETLPADHARERPVRMIQSTPSTNIRLSAGRAFMVRRPMIRRRYPLPSRVAQNKPSTHPRCLPKQPWNLICSLKWNPRVTAPKGGQARVEIQGRSAAWFAAAARGATRTIGTLKSFAFRGGSARLRGGRPHPPPPSVGLL